MPYIGKEPEHGNYQRLDPLVDSNGTGKFRVSSAVYITHVIHDNQYHA